MLPGIYVGCDFSSCIVYPGIAIVALSPGVHSTPVDQFWYYSYA